MKVSWGLNPAQTVVRSNSGAIFPQCMAGSIQTPWRLLGWVSSSVLWCPIASLWHAPAFSSFHPLCHIQNPKFKAAMTLESPLPLGRYSLLIMKYFVLSSRVCGITSWGDPAVAWQSLAVSSLQVWSSLLLQALRCQKQYLLC